MHYDVIKFSIDEWHIRKCVYSQLTVKWYVYIFKVCVALFQQTEYLRQ